MSISISTTDQSWVYAFSAKTASMIGNAAVFADPLFSPGRVIIFRQNNFLTKMVGMERQGVLSAETVSMYNDMVLKKHNLIFFLLSLILFEFFSTLLLVPQNHFSVLFGIGLLLTAGYVFRLMLEYRIRVIHNEAGQ